MAVRADRLAQNEEEVLLARYVERAERAEHQRLESARNPDGTTDLLLARYLRNLERQPTPEGSALEHSDIRTCSSCGRREEFLTTAGGWAHCPACGSMA